MRAGLRPTQLLQELVEVPVQAFGFGLVSWIDFTIGGPAHRRPLPISRLTDTACFGAPQRAGPAHGRAVRSGPRPGLCSGFVPLAAREFTADHRSVSYARGFVAETLAEWDAAAFDWAATTLVSELATNALLHARTGFTVTLRLNDEMLRLEVSDGSVRLPQQRHYGPDATTGRGLTLLRTLSRGDGVDLTSEGKTVWCELRADDADGDSIEALYSAFTGESTTAAHDADLLPGASWTDAGPTTAAATSQQRPAARWWLSAA